MKGELLKPGHTAAVTSQAILQRVASASVTVDKQLISSIGRGVLVFAAVAPNDTQTEIDGMVAKVLKMKLWPDGSGTNWKQSIVDIQGEILCVSQFTLLANTKKGSKPDFHGAAGGDHARDLYHYFVNQVQKAYNTEKVKDGVFQAMMDVALVNDGPVTLSLEVNPPEIPSKTKVKANKQSSNVNSGTSTPMVIRTDTTDEKP